MQKLTQKTAENFLYKSDSYLIRGACFELYKELGFGHKETIYQKGLEIKLKALGFNVNHQVNIPVFVNGEKVGKYIPDLVINDTILIELKAASMLTKLDIKQFWQYLRITPYKLGFLINFGHPGGIQIERRVYDTARKESA